MAEYNTNQQLLDHLKDFGSKHFLESGSVMPMFILVGVKDGKTGVFPIMAPFTNDEEKNMTIQAVKNLIEQYDGFRIAFMSETWVVTHEDTDLAGIPIEAIRKMSPEQITEAMGAPPRLNPKRKESLMMTCEDGTGSIGGSFPINRDEYGKPSLGEWQQWPKGMDEGRFSKLLRQKKETVH